VSSAKIIVENKAMNEKSKPIPISKKEFVKLAEKIQKIVAEEQSVNSAK